MTCSCRYTSYERSNIDPLPIIVTQRNRAPYERGRVRSSMANACAKLPISSEILDRAVDRISNQIFSIDSHEIDVDVLCTLIAEELGRLNEVARVRFEMEWRRTSDTSGCMEILMEYMRRRLNS